MKSNPDFLYRIVKFEHLIDIFETNQLHFTRPTVWEDPYEVKIDHPALKEVFAQCWCRRGVSDAMWRIYSPNHLGVRIKVSKTKLISQLNKAKKQGVFVAQKLGPVKYRAQFVIDDEHKKLVAQLKKKYEPRKALNSLMYKRKAFDHEAETRILLHAPQTVSDSKGLRIPIDPHKLIKTILADPRMPNGIFKAFKNYIQKEIKYAGTFSKSSIYTSKNTHRVGYDDES